MGVADSDMVSAADQMQRLYNVGMKITDIQEGFKAIGPSLTYIGAAGIDAVKNHRVWLMPEYAKAWGYPMPEALAIGELWMAKKLYPDAYKDVDVDAQAQDYYQRFYRVNWQSDAAK